MEGLYPVGYVNGRLRSGILKIRFGASRYYLIDILEPTNNGMGESFLTSLFTACFIGIRALLFY